MLSFTPHISFLTYREDPTCFPDKDLQNLKKIQICMDQVGDTRYVPILDIKVTAEAIKILFGGIDHLSTNLMNKFDDAQLERKHFKSYSKLLDTISIAGDYALIEIARCYLKLKEHQYVCLIKLNEKICEGKALQALRLIRLNPDVVKGVDEQLRTPLHLAVEMKSLKVVEDLLEKGADPDIQFYDEKSELWQATALHIAVSRGDVDMVRLLLKYGADVKKRSGSLASIPLHIEAVKRQKEVSLDIIQGLINAAPITIYSTDEEGSTVLDIAIDEHNFKLFRYLIDSGYSLERKNSEGCTPLVYAFYQNFQKAFSYLLQVGADFSVFNDQELLKQAIEKAYYEDNIYYLVALYRYGISFSSIKPIIDRLERIEERKLFFAFLDKAIAREEKSLHKDATILQELALEGIYFPISDYFKIFEDISSEKEKVLPIEIASEHGFREVYRIPGDRLTDEEKLVEAKEYSIFFDGRDSSTDFELRDAESKLKKAIYSIFESDRYVKELILPLMTFLVNPLKKPEHCLQKALESNEIEMSVDDFIEQINIHLD